MIGGEGADEIQCDEREWAVLCREILRRPDLVADPRFATDPDAWKTTASSPPSSKPRSRI